MKFRKKNVRMRGSKTHGYGSKKKHRGGGSRGGRGFAGSHKHKYSMILRHRPDHFGYKGFSSKKKKDVTINISDLNKLMKDNINEINLTELGYDKLLSRGELKRAVAVRVKKYSKKAKEKIEKAGGSIAA